MVARRDLNSPPAEQLADIVRAMKERAEASNTGAHGVKDMGTTGDSVWVTPDGRVTSVREVDEGLEAARQRIEDAEGALTQTGERLDAAEGTVADVAGDLSRVETVVIPGAVADLEAADQANAQAVADARQAAADSQAALATQIDEDIEAARTDLAADIATVRTSVDGKSKITQSVDAPPSAYDGAVGDRWERMSSMGSGGRLVSNWRWNGTVWVSTIIDGAVLGNVDASTVSAGFLDSARIKAGSIYADKIVSGLSQNMVPDPGFINADINAARLSNARGHGGASFAFVDGVLRIVADGTSTSNPYISMSGNTDMYAWASYSGMKLVASIEARAATGSGAVAMACMYRLRDGSIGSAFMTGGSPTITGEWQTFTWTYQLPADAIGYTVRPQLARTVTVGTIEFRSPFAAAPIGTTLIEPGAITTDRLAANSVAAGKIASDAVETQHLKAGAVTASKITFTDTLAGKVAQFMSVAAKEAVITGGLTANAATLIGQTVVDDINVQGKLIGTNGVFTGTVDFANINVTNEVLASKISGEHLYGTVVEGGEIITTNAGAGQVMLSDNGYVSPGDSASGPGIRITPPDMSELVTPPGMGPTANGFVITGGENVSGGVGYSIFTPRATEIRYTGGGSQATLGTGDKKAYSTADDGAGNEGRVETMPGQARVSAGQADGAYGVIEATGTEAVVATLDPSGKSMSQIRSNGREAYLWSTGSDGRGRILSVDSDGVWVKSDESGSWKHINLLGSTWEKVTLANGWKAYTGGGGYYQGLRAQRTPLGIRLDGMIQGGGVGQLASLPVSMQDLAAKQFPVVTQSGPGVMGVHQRSSDGWWMLSYLSGPATPGWVSVSVDAALA